MYVIGGQHFVTEPIRTRQFIFQGHTPILGLPFTVIPDVAMRRICGQFVRDIGDAGCWAYGSHRGQRGNLEIPFTSAGVPDKVYGSRLALLLLHDAPIPVGLTANREPVCPNVWCCRPDHRYGGTPSESKLDMYYAGHRTRPPRLQASANEYAALLEGRAARAGQPIRATRFFCEEVQEELRRGTVLQDVPASAAA